MQRELRARGEPALADLVEDAAGITYHAPDRDLFASKVTDHALAYLLYVAATRARFTEPDPAGNRFYLTRKGLSAVETYLFARFHMYRNVYFHKVVRSAEGMVKLALQRAKRLAVQGRLPWPPWPNSKSSNSPVAGSRNAGKANRRPSGLNRNAGPLTPNVTSNSPVAVSQNRVVRSQLAEASTSLLGWNSRKLTRD